MTDGASPLRRRQRLRARWGEYGELLAEAGRCGYRVVSLETWLRDGPGGEDAGPELLLRHDVDRDPRAALPMAAVERAHGVTSTWYFRWETADRRVISRLLREGFEVGLHYETLTRRALRGECVPGPEAEHRAAAAELAQEITRFRELHPGLRSICPHGDTRIPEVRNGVLWALLPAALRDGLVDGNEDLRGRRVAARITDADPAVAPWSAGPEPAAAFATGYGPVVLTTHPHHWAGSLGVVRSRLDGRGAKTGHW